MPTWFFIEGGTAEAGCRAGRRKARSLRRHRLHIEAYIAEVLYSNSHLELWRECRSMSMNI
jgi:hypothetical protein